MIQERKGYICKTNLQFLYELGINLEGESKLIENKLILPLDEKTKPIC
jgi:hypothetical protein